MVSYTHILDFLQMECTLSKGHNVPTVMQLTPGIPTIPNVKLIYWMKTKIFFWDIKGLLPEAAPITYVSLDQLQDTVGSLYNLLLVTEGHNEKQRTKHEQPPTIDFHYKGESKKCLYGITNVKEGDKSPLVYSQLVGSTKQYSAFQIVQDTVAMVAATMKTPTDGNYVVEHYLYPSQSTQCCQ